MTRLQQAHLRGFCKTAAAHGVDPEQLMKQASGITELQELRPLLMKVKQSNPKAISQIPSELLMAIGSGLEPSEVKSIVGDYQFPSVTEARALLKKLVRRASKAPSAASAAVDAVAPAKPTVGDAVKKTLGEGAAAASGASAAEGESAAEFTKRVEQEVRRNISPAKKKAITDPFTRSIMRDVLKKGLRQPGTMAKLVAKDWRFGVPVIGAGLVGGLASRMAGGDRKRNAAAGAAAGALSGGVYGGLLHKQLNRVKELGEWGNKFPAKAKGKMALLAALPALMGGAGGGLAGAAFGEKKKTLWEKIKNMF